MSLVKFLKGVHDQPEKELESALKEFANLNGFVVQTYSDIQTLTYRIYLRRKNQGFHLSFTEEYLKSTATSIIMERTIKSIPVEVWMDEQVYLHSSVQGGKTAYIEEVKKEAASSTPPFHTGGKITSSSSIGDAYLHYAKIWHDKGLYESEYIQQAKSGAKTYTGSVLKELSEYFDLSQKIICPHCDCLKSLSSAIIDLNDSAGYTREQIADWLEKSQVNINMKEK